MVCRPRVLASVCPDGGGERHIVDRDEKFVKLAAWSQRKFETIYEISDPPRMVAKLFVFVWSKPRDGQHMWWGMLKVHSSLGLQAQAGKAHRWCEHGWRRWSDFIVNVMKLPEGHLQKKWQADIAEVGTGDDGVGEGRFASTVALLALLVRWVSLSPKKGGLGSADDRESASLLLSAFLRKILEGPLRLTIFIDTGCNFGEIGWREGADLVDLQVTQGMTDIRSLVRRPHHLCGLLDAGLKQQGVDTTRPIALVSLLKGAMELCGGKDNHRGAWFARQLIWAFGRAIDEVCWRELGMIPNLPELPATTTSRSRCLMRYFLAPNEAFKDPVVLHVALDGSSLAEKSVVAGIVCLPTNVAAVFQPQVVLGRFRWPPHSCL